MLFQLSFSPAPDTVDIPRISGTWDILIRSLSLRDRPGHRIDIVIDVLCPDQSGRDAHALLGADAGTSFTPRIADIGGSVIVREVTVLD